MAEGGGSRGCVTGRAVKEDTLGRAAGCGGAGWRGWCCTASGGFATGPVRAHPAGDSVRTVAFECTVQQCSLCGGGVTGCG